MVQSFFVHKEQDKVGGLRANLQSNAAAAQVEVRGRAPSLGRSTTCDPTAAAAADNKSGLYYIRKDRYTLGFVQQIIGNRFVGSVHNFAQDLRGLFRLFGFILELGALGKPNRAGSHREEKRPYECK